MHRDMLDEKNREDKQNGRSQPWCSILNDKPRSTGWQRDGETQTRLEKSLSLLWVIVLVSFCLFVLTQTRDIWEKEVSARELPPSDWSVGLCVGAFSFFKNYFMCMEVLSAYISMYRLHTVLVQARRGRWILCNFSDRWLWAAMWFLGIKQFILKIGKMTLFSFFHI